MVEQKITFTVKSINHENNNVNTNVRILPLNFAADGSSMEIVRIFFIMHDESQKSKLDVLQEKGTYELSFNDEGMEVNKVQGGSKKGKKGGNTLNMCCAAGPDEPEPKKHYVMVNEGNKEIRVLVFPEFKLNITKQGEQPDETPGQDDQNNQDDQNENPNGPIPKNSDDSNNEDQNGPQPKKDDKKDDQPARNPEPTQEQINNAKDIFKNAENSDNKEDLIDALNNTKDTTKNSSSEDLKKQKEKIEDKLGQVDNKALVKLIREEVEKFLEELRIKPEDLSPEVKQKYDELNNNNNNNAKEIRTEIQNEAGEKSLNKIIAAVQQALKTKDKKQIDSKIKELQEFANSRIDFKKSAREKHKDEIQRLLAEGENYSSQGDNKNGFFCLNNPIMWVSGVALIGVVAGAILIIHSRRKKLIAK